MQLCANISKKSKSDKAIYATGSSYYILLENHMVYRSMSQFS